jgi:hypothetical protein
MEQEIFELKIQIKGITKPPVWRKIQIDAQSDLYKLNIAIQGAIGWANAHLHQFIINGNYYSIPFSDDLDGDMIDERKYKISDFLRKEKDKIIYEYDFGDSWEHTIVLERILEPVTDVKYPILISGKGMCPPEDCGGFIGYENLKEILSDPDHEEYQEMADWLSIEEDEMFDPNEFDLEDQRAYLREMTNVGDTMQGREFFS